MRALLVLAALLIASPAFAGKNPPARYGHAYAGKLVVHEVLQRSQVTRMCGKLYARYYKVPAVQAGYTSTMIGCSMGGRLDGDKTCYIVMLKNRPDIYRHELAHCNGWEANHPD